MQALPRVQWTAPLTTEADPAVQLLEVSLTFQIPHFQIIGLPSPEVGEARERVRAAIVGAGFEFPRKRVVLNLAPSSIRKRGTGADLAIALAILSKSKADSYSADSAPKICAWGELGLSGELRAAAPHLARALAGAWRAGCEGFILPCELLPRASRIIQTLHRSEPRSPGTSGLELLGAKSLRQAWEAFVQWSPGRRPTSTGQCYPVPALSTTVDPETLEALPLLHPREVRNVALALSGHHHILWIGPKGTGKSSALHWMRGLAPLPSEAMLLHHLLLSELAGAPTSTPPDTGSDSHPYSHAHSLIRAIHPQCTSQALTGSLTARGVRPGELARAHGGLILADELPEWPRDARELLREPLETGFLTLSQARDTLRFPARFLLAATGNGCECGGWPTELEAHFPLNTPNSRPCQCTLGARRRYLRRLSGPILDRIDLIVYGTSSGPLQPRLALTSWTTDERLRVVQATRLRIRRSRELALERWGTPYGLIPSTDLETWLTLHPQSRSHLDSLDWESPRSRHKALRVALTLASWEGISEPQGCHFLEARSYRRLP